VIAFVQGKVADLTLTSAVVEVGGVGLELNCTPGTLATLRVGDRVTLPSSLVVREESLTLFGFLDDDEKSVFELLQTASGVGPKLAQAMLAVHSPEQLRRAVTTEDVKTLTTVPGIGQKGAQRIILELKDRLGAPSSGGLRPAQAAQPAEEAWRGQVHAGLVGLGWSAKEADKAVEAVVPEAEATRDAGQEPAVASLLRAALQTLSRA
jgi:holliday junction DNA helicase RuvA